MTDEITAAFLDQFADHGVDVNGLIVPGRSVEAVLARHAINLVVNNNDEAFKLYLRGSATAVRYKGRDLLLTTQHQLRGVDETQVAMLTDNGSHIITSGGRRGYTPHLDTDAFDLIAFDFTAPCGERPDLKSRFFDLHKGPPDVVNTQVLAMLLAGYPFALQLYELEDKNHLGLIRRNVTCLPHSQPSDEATLVVQAVQPLDIDPDGMSGGPAFIIQYESDGPRAYFAGIIVRGGRELFTIVKVGFVLGFLRSVYG